MYEFSSKEDREKFKKTNYGKKTNLWLIISASVAIPFVAFEIIICYIDKSQFNTRFLNIMGGLAMISALIACYFDGKRDGAIEQFKRSNKNKKIDNV